MEVFTGRRLWNNVIEVTVLCEPNSYGSVMVESVSEWCKGQRMIVNISELTTYPTEWLD